MTLPTKRALAILPAFALLGLLAGCIAAQTPRALEPVVEDQVWRVADDDAGTAGAGYVLWTEAGLVGLDLRRGDPIPGGAEPILLLDSLAPPDDAYLAAPDTPRHAGATLAMETVFELGQEKLHLIPVLDPTRQRVLIVWAARSGLVLAPALLAPAPGVAPTDHASWQEGIAVLRSLKPRVLLPDPGRAVTELDTAWMETVRP